MLARSTYPGPYIEACYARTAQRLELFDALKPKPSAAFAEAFFADLVLTLEMSFVHRLRANEGKDGNPLNEVRMIAASVLEHGGVFTQDKTIKWKPEASITGLAFGDRISLNREKTGALVDAFFEDLARKYAS